MGLLCFFHRNQTKYFVWFLWKKHSKPDFCEKKHSMRKMGLGLLGMSCWVWVTMYGFAVFGFCEKCRGFDFLCMGCLAKRWIGREGNGVKGRLPLNERMGFFEFAVIATVAKRMNGLVFCVWVCVWFLEKNLGLLWLIFPRGLGLLWLNGLPSQGFGFTQSMGA